jgi:hypothetical protein
MSGTVVQPQEDTTSTLIAVKRTRHPADSSADAAVLSNIHEVDRCSRFLQRHTMAKGRRVYLAQLSCCRAMRPPCCVHLPLQRWQWLQQPRHCCLDAQLISNGVHPPVAIAPGSASP